MFEKYKKDNHAPCAYFHLGRKQISLAKAGQTGPARLMSTTLCLIHLNAALTEQK